MRTHVAAQTLNQVSVLLITAGLKPSLRMEILKKRQPEFGTNQGPGT